jgi:adenosylhomocysteine nucleosidase
VALGVVAALAPEARTLSGRPPRDGRPYRTPKGALVVVSGPGAGKARRAAEELVEAGACALASWGCAGALDPALLPGGLVVPEAVACPEGRVLRVHPAWRERLCEHLLPYLPIHSGILVQSPSVLGGFEAKAEVRAQTGGAAVDMESAAVAEVARTVGVPFLAVRAVVDAATASVPEAARCGVNGSGKVAAGPLLRSLVRDPGSLFLLVRLGFGFRAALRTLARVAQLTRGVLLSPEEGRVP